MRSALLPAPSELRVAAGARRVRLAAWLARFDLAAPGARYVLRSILAAWLALTVAYLLQLETPYSAASTVLLVINPVQGAVIGKGAWRVFGTLAGMLAAVVLMSAFAQMPWLFVLGLGAWLGLCVAGMTLLRHFRASGTVVAGYTVGLATFGAMQHPLSTFAHVVGRGSTVVVGVVCLGLVSALFSARRLRGRLEALLARLGAGVAEALALRYGRAEDEDTAAVQARADSARRSLIAEIYTVDDLLVLGKAESADLAQRAAGVREAMAALFAALVGGASAAADWQVPARLRAGLEQSWREVGVAIGSSARDVGAALDVLRRARVRLAVISAQAAAGQGALSIVVDRAIDQIDDYALALHGIATLHAPHLLTARRGGGAPVHFHRDLGMALRNGLRAMATLVLAGAFWIVTGWPHGDMMLLVLAPYCALLATAANPVAAAIELVKGTLLAVPMAWLCAFGVLPHIDGLPLLLATLGLFWLPGICATWLPRYGLAGLAYLVGFNTLTGAGNPMHYDLGLFLNWSVAWILATFFVLLGFRLLWPRDPARDSERLRCRIRDEALAVLGGARANPFAWRRRQQHRLAQLGALLKSRAEATDRATADALASLHLGRELLRLRQWLRDAPRDALLALPMETALRRMAARADDPVRAARHARRAARSLCAARTPSSADRQRLAAVLLDVAVLLERHADYFAPARSRARAQ